MPWRRCKSATTPLRWPRLRSAETNGVSVDLLGRAVALAAARPDLLWLQIQQCAHARDCQPGPLEQRLRVLDPTTAAWLGTTLTRAYVAKDAAAVDAALAALASIRQVSLSEAVVAVIGGTAAIAIPAYQAATKSCQGERLDRPRAR